MMGALCYIGAIICTLVGTSCHAYHSRVGAQPDRTPNFKSSVEAKHTSAVRYEGLMQRQIATQGTGLVHAIGGGCCLGGEIWACVALGPLHWIPWVGAGVSIVGQGALYGCNRALFPQYQAHCPGGFNSKETSCARCCSVYERAYCLPLFGGCLCCSGMWPPVDA